MRRITKLNKDERAGLNACLLLAVNNWKLSIAVVLSGLAVALFEGGSLGILVLAADVLSGQNRIDLSGLGSIAGYDLNQKFQSFDNDVVFIILVAAAVAAQLFKSTASYCSQSGAVHLGIRVAKQLQKRVTARIMDLEYADIRSYSSGTLFEYVKFAGTVPRKIVNSIVCQSMLSVFLLVVYLIAMFSISLKLASIALAIGLVISLILTRVVKGLEIIGKRVTLGMLKSTRVSVELLNASRLIRIFGRNDVISKRLSDLREYVLDTQKKSELAKIALDPSIEAILIIAIGAFLIGGYLISEESIIEILPRLLICTFMLYRMMPQLKKLNANRFVFAELRKSMEALGKFIGGERNEYVVQKHTGSKFSGLKNKIEFQNVSYTHPGSRDQAVAGVNLELKKGQMVAIVGASGAGKSTLADLLIGLIRPTIGKVLIDGVDLNAIDRSEWLTKIGVVDQEVFLLNTTIIENIRFTRDECSSHQVESAAKLANADSFIEPLVDGYDTVIGDRGNRLSGGQKQRLALARALLGNPEILILDEATSALDAESELLIRKTIEGLHNDVTLLVIAHRLSTVTTADLIVVLEEGRIIEKGTKEELLQKGNKFHDWWLLQAESSELILQKPFSSGE